MIVTINFEGSASFDHCVLMLVVPVCTLSGQYNNNWFNWTIKEVVAQKIK